MFSKVAVLGVLLAISQAALVQQGHQAISSQSFIRHDQPIHQSAPGHYSTPVLHHQIQPAPVVEHSPSFLQHSGPISHHATRQQLFAPVQQHYAPTVQHVAPVVHHVAPVVQHVAPVVQHVAPIVQHVSPIAIDHAVNEEHHAPASYEFSYSVEDPHTGDHKSQHEVRHGDVVKGEYSLLQPDGVVRKVEYSADHHSGFNAIVHNSAPSKHDQPQYVHAPIIAGHH